MYASLPSETLTETIFFSDKYLGRFAGDVNRKAFSLHVNCLLLLTNFKTRRDMNFFVKFSNIIFHEYVFKSSHVFMHIQPGTTRALPKCVSTLKYFIT